MTNSTPQRLETNRSNHSKRLDQTVRDFFLDTTEVGAVPAALGYIGRISPVGARLDAFQLAVGHCLPQGRGQGGSRGCSPHGHRRVERLGNNGGVTDLLVACRRGESAVTESTTTETDLHSIQWSALRPGDHVEAIRKGTVVHHGIMEESISHLGVVWIRETVTGERQMLLVGDVGLRRR